jgi:antagonist of KipI
MSIKIIRQGLLTTLQDAGRNGYRSIGIGSNGAMDIYAMKFANYLAGNNENKAVMEINFPAPEILFQEDAIISLTGADFTATINETAVPLWSTLFVKKDSILKFNKPNWGTKLYLAVYKGWQAQKWLNSYSTHLKVGAGGYSGRALQKNDIINFNSIIFPSIENKIFPWHISANDWNKIYQPLNEIRCIKGVEWNLLDDISKQNFEKNNFSISHQSDRMGYCLKSESLLLQEPTELISSAVDAGTIQLLPDGNCIVLMADHQTTGGYPRIAAVLKKDLPKLAQTKPGQAINFIIVSLKEAEEEFILMKQTLNEVKKSCLNNFKKYILRID